MKKNAPAITHRAHVFYSGKVQGVGFRFTAERLALDLDLYGFVKNLPDGRVELVCEGTQEKIESLLREIKESVLGPFIKNADCVWEQPTRQFSDFTVEFVL